MRVHSRVQFRNQSGASGKLGLAAAAIAALLLMAGCGSDADALAPIEVDPETTAASDSVSASAESTSSVTTVTTTTTAAAPESTQPLDSSGKPIIEIPTEWDSDLEEIFGRYKLYHEALDVMLGPPAADPNYAPFAELVADVVLVELAGQIERFRDDGLMMVFPEESITDHIVRLPNPSVLTKTEGNEVIIQDCWVDDSIVQTVDGEVRETAFESSLRNVTMRVIDGEWKVWAVVTASPESSGYQECKDLIDELS